MFLLMELQDHIQHRTGFLTKLLLYFSLLYPTKIPQSIKLLIDTEYVYYATYLFMAEMSVAEDGRN
jgi:hypothetical protein